MKNNQTKLKEPHEQQVDSRPPDENKLYSTYFLLQATCTQHTDTSFVIRDSCHTLWRKSDKRSLVHYM